MLSLSPFLPFSLSPFLPFPLSPLLPFPLSPLSKRPGGDGGVDLFHQLHGAAEGDDDALVVGQVVVGELAAAAVLEPFVEDLVAADVEGPDVGRDAVEVLGGVDVDAAGPLDAIRNPVSRLRTIAACRTRPYNCG